MFQSPPFFLTMCMWPENTHRLRQYRVVPASITFNDPVSLWRTPGIWSVLIDRRYLAQDWVYDFPRSLDSILTYEECRITSHSISKKSFIGWHPISVVAAHDKFYSFTPHGLSRNLGSGAERD